MCIHLCEYVHTCMCIYIGVLRGNHKHLSEKGKYNMVSSSQLLIDKKICYIETYLCHIHSFFLLQILTSYQEFLLRL